MKLKKERNLEQNKEELKMKRKDYGRVKETEGSEQFRFKSCLRKQ